MNRIFNILLVLKEKNITVWESEGKLNFRAPKGVNIESELKLMKQHKSEIVEFLKNESDLNKINIEPEKKYESFPLTDVQTAYLLGRKDVFDYGSVACHIYMEYEYEYLEPEKATICWNKLIQRHEMLRTVFSDNEGTQKVLETVPKFEIVYRDISEMDTMYANQYLENVRDQMGQRVYDASKWPIFDIRITKTKNNVIMHFSMEFLIADWMSMQILVSEFETIYAGKEKRLPELSLTFRDYVVFQFKQRNSLAYIEDKEYWMKRIQELPGAPSLPRIGNKQDRVYFSRWHLELAHRDWDKIKVYAKKISVTPTSVVLAAYAAVLERWSENSSFCLNLTLLNRQPLHKEIEYLVGDFTDVVILNIDWRNQKAFSEHVVEIQKQLFNDLDHRLFSGVEVMREISREFGAERALMPYIS